jgi:hypothetical protein
MGPTRRAKQCAARCLHIVCTFGSAVYRVYLVFLLSLSQSVIRIRCAYSPSRYAPRGNTRAREASI